MNILNLSLIGFTMFLYVVILLERIKEFKERKRQESSLLERKKFEERKKHIMFRPNLYETVEQFRKAINSNLDLEWTYYYDSYGDLRGNMYKSSDDAYHTYYLKDEMVMLELKNINGAISKNIVVCKLVRHGDDYTDEDLIQYNASDYEDELNDLIILFNQNLVSVFDRLERDKLLTDLMIKIKNKKTINDNVEHVNDYIVKKHDNNLVLYKRQEDGVLQIVDVVEIEGTDFWKAVGNDYDKLCEIIVERYINRNNMTVKEL